MKTLNPYLFVRKLLVYAGAKVAYEAVFRNGVNIIRGKNSSGKSTVMNFLFYGLGGEYNRWTPEALLCTAVYVQIEINGATISLQRQISVAGPQPISLYWGPLSDGLATVVEWTEYPLRRSESKESISQILFRALQLPEVKTEDENNVTIHQVLRLIFIDQLSQPYSLMIDEKFDSPLTRKAVGDLLLGVYDNELYSAQLNLKKLRKDLEAQEGQYKGLVDILRASEQYTSLVEVKNAIEVLSGDLQTVEGQISAATTVKSRKQADTSLTEMMKLVTTSRNILSKSLSELESISFDVADSIEFVQTLRSKINALTESIETRKILGQLPITQCPHCLTNITRAVQEDSCVLCTQPLSLEAEQSQPMRMRQELEFQLIESEKLLSKKIEASAKIEAKLPEFRANAKSSQKTYDNFLNKAQSTRDENTDKLLIQKGNIEKEIQFLQRQQTSMMLLEDLRLRVVSLRSSIKELLEVIDYKLRLQNKNLVLAEKSISAFAVDFLRKDGDYETSFADAKEVKVDFGKNTFFVDGRNNFSASSVTYLKNSVRYGIFFASLDNEFFRYPRLILCDNMEDKGMQEERSKTLQRSVVALSQAIKIEHQIIFSTSMIDESLNNDEYCIGDFYGPRNKTLKLL